MKSSMRDQPCFISLELIEGLCQSSLSPPIQCLLGFHYFFETCSSLSNGTGSRYPYLGLCLPPSRLPDFSVGRTVMTNLPSRPRSLVMTTVPRYREASAGDNPYLINRFADFLVIVLRNTPPTARLGSPAHHILCSYMCPLMDQYMPLVGMGPVC